MLLSLSEPGYNSELDSPMSLAASYIGGGGFKNDPTFSLIRRDSSSSATGIAEAEPLRLAGATFLLVLHNCTSNFLHNINDSEGI